MSDFTIIRSKLMKEIGKCELCGSRRGLDLHHIIPRVCGGKDEYDNLILVCSSCHSKLTPHNLLTKEGLKKVKEGGKTLGQRRGATLNIKKKIPAMEIIKKHSKDFDGMLSDKEVMRMADVSRNTYYKYKRELMENET